MPASQAEPFEKIDFVFLDREGVLNRKPPEGKYITRWKDFVLYPRVEEALARLKSSGRKVILVTNQRCVALGLCSKTDVRELHERLQKKLGEHNASLDAIYFCPHDEGECNCRKPKTGMFEQAFGDFPDARSDNSVMVGDSLSDIEAGRRLGMRTIFISGDADGEPVNRKPGTDEASSLANASANSLLNCVEKYLCP